MYIFKELEIGQWFVYTYSYNSKGIIRTSSNIFIKYIHGGMYGAFLVPLSSKSNIIKSDKLWIGNDYLVYEITMDIIGIV